MKRAWASNTSPTRLASASLSGCIAVEDGSGLLPGSDYLPGPIAERLVGAEPPGAGMLYGLDTDAVYTERGGRIYRWDGRKETDLGSVSQAMASLLLRWSGR